MRYIQYSFNLIEHDFLKKKEKKIIEVNNSATKT